MRNATPRTETSTRVQPQLLPLRRTDAERRRALLTELRLWAAAHARVVVRRTLLFASLSAPRSSSNVTMDAWPPHAAKCSGVAPSCARHTQNSAAQHDGGDGRAPV
jgi:hypothetical protein